MNDWLFYTVPKFFIHLYVRNLITNMAVFIFLTVFVFGVFPGAGSIFTLWLMTDVSFYHAMKRFKDDNS